MKKREQNPDEMCQQSLFLSPVPPLPPVHWTLASSCNALYNVFWSVIIPFEDNLFIYNWWLKKIEMIKPKRNWTLIFIGCTYYTASVGNQTLPNEFKRFPEIRTIRRKSSSFGLNSGFSFVRIFLPTFRTSGLRTFMKIEPLSSNSLLLASMKEQTRNVLIIKDFKFCDRFPTTL